MPAVRRPDHRPGSRACRAEGKTKKAAEHHADVVGWTLIADKLAPDGIPGELLAQALKPINDALAQSAADTGWQAVTIDAEMAIRTGGRPYALLSESEQWRTDAMLTIAIAQLLGIKLALFDRFDVLDLDGRGEALGWFDVLAAPKFPRQRRRDGRLGGVNRLLGGPLDWILGRRLVAVDHDAALRARRVGFVFLTRDRRRIPPEKGNAMNKSKHTTKSGPGRRHVEGTYRGGRNKSALPSQYPGAKLARKAARQQLTKRG